MGCGCLLCEEGGEADPHRLESLQLFIIQFQACLFSEAWARTSSGGLFQPQSPQDYRYSFFRYFCQEKPCSKRTVRQVRSECEKLMLRMRSALKLPLAEQHLLADRSTCRAQFAIVVEDCKESNICSRKEVILQIIECFRGFPAFFHIQDERGYTVLDYVWWRVQVKKEDYMAEIADLLEVAASDDSKRGIES